MGRRAHMTRGVRKLLTIADVRGDVDALEQLVGDLPESGIDAVALVGNLVAPWSKPAAYRAIFRALGEAGRPAFWVPGPTDAPISEYLSECANLEIVYPFLHGIHGAFALEGGHVLFAGMGGEIVDDPGTIRSEEALLKYSGWEVEYRLKVVREFDEYQKVFLFTTRPAHKGLKEPGSEVLAELIKTYRPRLAVVGGYEQVEERLGNTLVVCPGALADGYALVDLHELGVEFTKAVEPTAV
jgi:Icc-related predicted phosphoesterase